MSKRISLKIWQGINELIQIKPKRKAQPKMLTITKNLITNDYAVATEFNSFLNILATKSDKLLKVILNFGITLLLF